MRAVVGGVVMSMESGKPVRVIVDWLGPASKNHEHAVKPPTPDELRIEGSRALAAIYDEAVTWAS
jgi:hypothetical protein